jgi:hypothetical protein
MAGYDDPRFLQAKIEALEKQVRELKTTALSFTLQQRGALPGSLRAVAVNDQGQKGSMWSNFINVGPGQGPYTAVTDTVGTIRVELGNLAANGNSPAQYGLRANDASGVPIFDSLGLIATMKVLGTFTDNSPDQITATSPTVLDSVTVTFSLARQSNVLAWFMASATTAGATGNFAFARLNFDGVAHGPTGIWDKGNAGYTAQSIAHFQNLAAGSHTVDFRVNVDSGQTWTNFQTTLDVFLLGG